MKKRMKLTLPFVAILFFSSIFSFHISAQSSDGATLDGELYVKLTDDILIKRNENSNILPAHILNHFVKLYEEYEVTDVVASFHFAKEDHIRRILRVYFSANHLKDEFIKALEALPVVEYAEPVPLLLKSLVPNDLGANNTNGQWNLHRIRAQQAWDISTGSTSIRVAVVDDAVLITHPDLAPNCVTGRDVSNNTANANPPTTAPNNTWDHGTHVAGTVSAATNNGTGIASIGFNTKIIPVKATNSATTISHGYEGVSWSSSNGADVINMSWGGTFGGQTGANVVNAAFNNGVTLVAAAGNGVNGVGVTTVFYPAGYINVISVASTTTNDQKSGFSNYGTWIDISSPGSSIRSTIRNNAYGNKSGTSMASPLVAGLCGLILSVNPTFTPTQVKACLQSSADNINQQNGNFIGQLGAGRINAENALLCASASTVQFDAGISAITNPNGSYCTNSIAPTVTLKNFGTSNLTSVTISYQLNAGNPLTFNWTGNLASQQTAQITLPAITVPNGVNTFSATTTGQLNGNQNDAFANNNATASNFSVVSAVGIQLPFTENFESGNFTQNQWTIENSDNWLTWEIIQVGGNGPGTQSVRLPFYSYSATGQRDALISRTFDFSGYTDINMTFKHAYRRYNTASTDSLIIYVSTDCGQTWPNRVFARGENGQGTFATAFTSVEDFIPEENSVWCSNGTVGANCYSINLSAFGGQSSVRIKFESYNNYGNNLYLDDINIDGISSGNPPIANFSASGGTSICQGSQITFTNQSTNAPQTYQWTFPGGTPATSTAANPTVTYNTPGTYTVELIANNAIGSDSEIKTNYITVNPQPLVTASSSPTESCFGIPVTLSATGANTYTWFPVSGLTQGNTGSSVSAAPNNTITYTVNGASAAGCIATAQVTVNILTSPPVPSLNFNEQSNQLSTTAIANSYQWFLNGVPIPGANSATYTPTQSGLYSLEIAGANGCVSKSASINVVLTSLNALNNKLNVSLYPNPNDGRFILEHDATKRLTVDVFNLLGAKVSETQFIQANETKHSFDFAYLPKGIYLLRLSNADGNFETIRFTKMQ